MRTLALIASWYFGLQFLIWAVVAAFRSVAAAVPLFLAAMLLLPPVRNRVHQSTKRTLSRKSRLISVAVLTVMAVVLLGTEISCREHRAAAIALQARMEEYRAQKPAILDSIDAAISRSDFEAAISQIDRYGFAEDATLVALKRVATEKQQEKLSNERRAEILTELPRVPASEYARNKQLYEELLQLCPENPTYRAKYDDYSAKLAAKEERQRLAGERAAREEWERAARKERIESQFSAWDGAHRNLTMVIKASMNDPDSYKHDETTYWDMGDYLVVRTAFRGKNVFGGVVRNWVKAKVDLDGNVIAILEQGP
jgi:hypothetical protein